MNRDLFGYQLEVTARLLQVHKQRLDNLKAEVELYNSEDGESRHSSLHPLTSNQRSLSLGILVEQHDQLYKEYHDTAAEAILSSRNIQQSSRSLPALGLKQAVKCRTSIFGTLVKVLDKHKRDRAIHGVPTSLSNLSEEPFLRQKESEEAGSIIYENGHLVSGTLDSLIFKLVPTDRYYPDRTYVFAFLLCSRLFISPSSLLRRLSEISSSYIDSHPEKALAVANHLTSLLNEWTETFPYDFREESMMRTLKEITQKCVTENQDVRPKVGHLTQALVHKLGALSNYEEVIAMAHLSQRLGDSDFEKSIIDVCSNPAELARQLTLIDVERMSNIGPEEFVQTFVCIDELVAKEEGMQKKTSNLESYVEWFNRLSYLVATEICMCPKRKERAKIIDFFLEVGKCCLQIGNFNALMAIIVGLSVNAVARMKKTWDRVTTNKFATLEELMSPHGNFRSYRSQLRLAVDGGQKRSDCVIPFFTLLLKDLYFLNEGVRNRLPNDHVNFEKFWQLSKQVSEIMAWKETKCSYEPNKPILNYLLTRPVCHEEGLYKSSFEVEPPESQFERDRFKSVRMKIPSG